MIRMKPNEHVGEAPFWAFRDALAEIEMLGYFDDVVCTSIRWCVMPQEGVFIDYDISEEECEAWYEGRASLAIQALPHDPSRFADDFGYENSEGEWVYANK